SKGRANLATLIPMPHPPKGANKDFVLQWDESLPPYYDTWIDELHSLKNAHCPQSPPWFAALPKHQQSYLCNLKLDSLSLETIIEHLNSFSRLWENVKKDAVDLSIDLATITNHAEPLPNWYEQ